MTPPRRLHRGAALGALFLVLALGAACGGGGGGGGGGGPTPNADIAFTPAQDPGPANSVSWGAGTASGDMVTIPVNVNSITGFGGATFQVTIPAGISFDSADFSQSVISGAGTTTTATPSGQNLTVTAEFTGNTFVDVAGTDNLVNLTFMSGTAAVALTPVTDVSFDADTCAPAFTFTPAGSPGNVFWGAATPNGSNLQIPIRVSGVGSFFGATFQVTLPTGVALVGFDASGTFLDDDGANTDIDVDDLGGGVISVTATRQNSGTFAGGVDTTGGTNELLVLEFSSSSMIMNENMALSVQAATTCNNVAQTCALDGGVSFTSGTVSNAVTCNADATVGFSSGSFSAM